MMTLPGTSKNDDLPGTYKNDDVNRHIQKSIRYQAHPKMMKLPGTSKNGDVTRHIQK
jgi:hypothetical protein